MFPAMLRAARAFYLVTIFGLALALLFPAFGWVDKLESVWGEGRVVEVGVGFALLGVFSEHLLGGITRLRQGALARAMLKLNPILKHKGAIEILIRALESENEEVSATAHRELQRITKQNLPAEGEAWRRWLRSEVKNSKSSELPSSGEGE